MTTSAYRSAVIEDTPVFYAPLDEASSPTDRKSLAVLEEVNSPTGASAFDADKNRYHQVTLDMLQDEYRMKITGRKTSRKQAVSK